MQTPFGLPPTSVGLIVQILPPEGHRIDLQIIKDQDDGCQAPEQYDPMTKMLNRRQFWQTMNRLDQEKAADYCLLLADIDGLRLINNVYGQEQGDQVLLDVAEVIKSVFQERATVFNLGGDDFAVLHYHTDMAQVTIRSQTMKELCSRVLKQPFPVSISWGAACWDEAACPQALFHLCEARLRDNKLLHESSAQSQVLLALREALSLRNAETAEHMTRMEYMVGQLGRCLDLTPHDHDRLILLAAMHDVGKLGIPDRILTKPGPLTPEEWDVMRSHAQIGHQIAISSVALASIAQEILHHHERWDGTGYPSGKQGEEIPLLAQIIAVVDAYDVITHDRPYKKAQSHAFAVEELRRCTGTHFSPRVTGHFLKLFEFL